MRVGVISVVGDFHGERPTSSSNNVPDLVPVGMQIAGKPRRVRFLLCFIHRVATPPDSSSCPETAAQLDKLIILTLRGSFYLAFASRHDRSRDSIRA